ncbi:MAG TPA: C2H2-type zinc finger protein [Nitrososphaeraceae archaeon]
MKIDLFHWKRGKEHKGQDELFKCKNCGTTFSDKEKLKRHNEKAHSGKK